MVSYELAGQEVANAERPDYAAAIDFGPLPLQKRLVASARDEQGRTVARDSLLLNPGAHRFDIQLSGLEVVGSQLLRARLRARVPEGAELSRIELSAEEQLLGTFYEAAAEPLVSLPRSARASGRPTVVTAVVHLDDGRTTETTALIGADIADEIDVDLVEIYASVTSRAGTAVLGLEAADFQLLEEGRPQSLRQVTFIEDLPVNVVLLLDASSSMVARLEILRSSAARFLDTVVGADDRAALVVFENYPQLLVPLTNDGAQLRQATSLIWAHGGTAFRDSVVASLHYLTGLRGRRALVVLTDGVDEHSRVRADQVLEYAQRAGIAVYTVGIRLRGMAASEYHESEYIQAERQLSRLARHSGGLYFHIDNAGDFDRVYRRIEQDLRSQYLLSYQSDGTSEGFRRIEVEVDRPRVKVRTAAGYYP